MDSSSNLLGYWDWYMDYSLEKAHAITLVGDDVLAAGHHHANPETDESAKLFIAGLEWDNSIRPPVFNQLYTYKIECELEWRRPHVSDLGYLDDWDWGELRNFDSYIVIGSDPTYTPQGEDDENRAFCIAVQMNEGEEDPKWLELDYPYNDRYAYWSRLLVSGDDIYCAGIYDSDQNEDVTYDAIIMGMPDISTGEIVCDIETFTSPSLSFPFFWVRIAEAGNNILTVASAITDDMNQDECIVIVTWDSSGEPIDSTIMNSEFSGYDKLQPFALKYYPDNNAALLLLSYRNNTSLTNKIAAYKITLSDNGTIGATVQLGSDYPVPFQEVPDENGCMVQLNAITPKDFYFTDEGSDIREFAGYGCGTMMSNYSGASSSHYKHSWLFEFEHTDINSSAQICFDGSEIHTHCPSHSGIQFYSIPEEYGDRFDISVFDLSGRQIVQLSDLSAADLLSSGILGIQQGVYFVNIRSLGQNEYHTVKCIVLD